jgi:hypothetical protein
MTINSVEEPFGAAFHEREGVTHFTLLSRGDRIRGVLSSAGDAETHTLVLVLSPDGTAGHPLLAQLASEWQDWTAVASIDLSLCGGRTSEKLSAVAFEAEHPVAKQIQGDLELQIQADLERTTELLADHTGIHESRMACLAVGLGARLMEGPIARKNPFWAIESNPDADADWLSAAAQRIRDALGD